MKKFIETLAANNFLKQTLLRNILIVSLAIAIVLPLYDILFIYPSFTQLLIEEKRDDAIRIARHLSSQLVSEDIELRKSLVHISLLNGVQQLNEIRDNFELIKLKFFSESGEVLFSTDPREVGTINKESYFHEIVARGNIHAEVVHKDTESLERQVLSADVVETYVPLMRDDKFLGAFEIYYDITGRREQLDALLSRSSIIVFALASGLLMVIVLTLIKENKTITERNRAEEGLRESERRFRETTDLLPTIICETGIDMKITYMNRAGLSSLGYSQTDIELGIKLLDLIHPEDKAKLAQHTDEILQGRELVAAECCMLRKDGSEIAVFVNLAPIHKEGRIVGMRASIADINELKNLQARLLEAQKMEAIATLAGGIAHEFNNALGAVIPNADLLRMRFPDNEEIIKYVQPLHSSAKRMAHLTNQLLAYARGGKYFTQHISLSGFVRDTLPLITHSFDPDIQVETDLSEHVCDVKVDLAQMQMVLLAVLANAAESIERSGCIRIITRTMEVDEEHAVDHAGLQPGPYACLAIEDDGRGMDAETRARVFEPFFSTKYVGRGLGMAAVYGIVKNHGGLVLVDSALEKGAVIRIFLPCSGRRV
ncbi:MAG: PAS domain S-box protein [Deltaproteobacteria bacterium]|nr:MAG: PAS domain S-box protein [Deltaproteobacteria bacterium]